MKENRIKIRRTIIMKILNLNLNLDNFFLYGIIVHSVWSRHLVQDVHEHQKGNKDLC